MKIKNFEHIASSPERKAALEIIEEGLQSIDTRAVVRRSVQQFGDKIVVAGEEVVLQKQSRIFLVSIGKCALEAAQEIEKIIGKNIHAGIVIDVHEGVLDHPAIQLYVGDHPFPSERNIYATKAMIEMLSDMTEKDVVIAIISGGGSSLLCQPENLTCFEEKEIVENLFRSGASIEKVNTVRKHISLAKGGYLAKYAYPARLIAMIFSDVPGNNIEFIASGPTVLDTTTVNDAKKVLAEFNLSDQCAFAEKGLIETPKDQKFFNNVKNIIVVSNEIALNAMKEAAHARGYNPTIRTKSFSGHARHIGAGIASELKTVSPNSMLLYGGESTVVVKGIGKGGRNQEVALSALRFSNDDEMIISIASDGKDNTEFAGGICDIITKKHAAELDLDIRKYLGENDSFEFFKRTGDYIETGVTGSNVSDLVLAVRFKK